MISEISENGEVSIPKKHNLTLIIKINTDYTFGEITTHQTYQHKISLKLQIDDYYKEKQIRLYDDAYLINLNNKIIIYKEILLFTYEFYKNVKIKHTNTNDTKYENFLSVCQEVNNQTQEKAIESLDLYLLHLKNNLNNFVAKDSIIKWSNKNNNNIIKFGVGEIDIITLLWDVFYFAHTYEDTLHLNRIIKYVEKIAINTKNVNQRISKNGYFIISLLYDFSTLFQKYPELKY